MYFGDEEAANADDLTQNLVRDRYAGVFADVEGLIDDHSSY